MDITAQIKFVRPKQLTCGNRILWNDAYHQLRWGTVIHIHPIDNGAFPRTVRVTVAPGTADWDREISFAIWTKVPVVLNEHAVPGVRSLSPDM